MSHIINIDNTGIITSLLVKDHPEWMWYREAIQNAIEASKSYISQKNIESAEIKIRKLNLKDLIAQNGHSTYKNKLSILNLGGMSATELNKAVQLGGTGKTASLNGNFGVGIKTSVLNWSDLVIITYKNGIGHFVWLGKEYTNGADFVIKAFSGDPFSLVEECTSWIIQNAVSRSYDLNHDFTEVIILGKELNQDTYLHTFGFGPTGEDLKKVNANHIRENICKRYFRIPENIKIKIDPSANNEASKGNTITFMTFLESFEKVQTNPKIAKSSNPPRSETVTTVDGINIHYFWDSPCGDEYSLSNIPSTRLYDQSSWSVAFSGFVWRDEIYDPHVNTHRKWKTVAFRLGIQDNFNYFRIFVELPDRMVTTDKYRTDLIAGTEKLEFDSDENLSMIQSHMPAWYKEKAKETKKELKTDLNDALQNLFARYSELNRPLIAKSLQNAGALAKRTQSPATNFNLPPAKKATKGSVQQQFKNPQFSQPDVPSIREASEHDIKQWQINDNFGYLIEKGDGGRDLLIYNPNYASIDKIATLAISKLPDPEAYFDLAKEKTKEQIILNSALWIMICRSRMALQKMSLYDFGISTSSDFLDTYIFARELQISEDVARFIRDQKRDDDKLIRTEVEVVE